MHTNVRLNKHLRKMSHHYAELIDEVLNDSTYIRQSQKPVFRNDQLADIKQEDIPDHSKMRFMITNDSKWTDYSSFKIAKNILSSNFSILRGKCTHDGNPDDFATEQLGLFVTQLAKDGGHKSHDALCTTLSKFHNHLKHLRHVTHITPLYNVRGDFSVIKLTPSLYVREATVREYSKIVRLDSTVMKDIDQHQRRLKFVLISRAEDTTEETLQSESTSAYVLAMNALRLFGDGHPQFGRVYEIESEYMDVGTIESLPSYYKPPPTLKTVCMSENNIRKFVSFHGMITKKLANSRSEFLQNAMNMFGTAYMHKTPSKKIIDYVISLEALLTSSAGESTMKLAHRTAAISADTDTERAATWEFMRGVYKFRSGIIHSAKEKPIKINSFVMSAGDVESKLHMMTKKSIRRMIALIDPHKKQDDILDELDRSIYDRNEMKRLQKKWSRSNWDRSV